MRILQLGPLYNNHLRRWSANAAALGCTVYAAGHIRPGRRQVDLGGVAEAVDVLPTELIDGQLEGQVAWLRRVIEMAEPDLVQAHTLWRWGYLAATSEARPLAVTAWGSDLYLASAADRRRADGALVMADGVLARSRHMRREMIARGVSPDRIHDVDLGVDLERFRPAEAAERALLKSLLGLPPGPIVLSFRAGTELYNLDVVLDAFRVMRRRVPDASIVLVHGDAPLAPPVRERLRRLIEAGAAQAIGHVEHAEMPGYLRAADAGISIPRSDGSPSSVWEALACGLPVVLSDLPQIEERVGGSGAARLVPARAGPVASALAEILTRPELRDRMALAGRDWALANADERDQIERLGRLYAAISRPPAARRTPMTPAGR